MFGGENDPLMMIQQLRMFHQWGQAKDLLDKMIDEKGDEADVMLYRLRGECFINLDMPLEALEDVDTAMRLGPEQDENKNLNLIAATSHIKLGNPEEAQQAAKESGDDGMIQQTREMDKIIKETDKLYDEGKFLECGKMLDKILVACTHAKYLIERRLEIAWMLGQSKVYEEKAKSIINDYRDDTELHFRYGVSLICNGKFAEGKRNLIKVKNMEDPPANISEYNTIATNTNNYLSQIKKYIDNNQIGDAELVLEKFNNTARSICSENSGIISRANFLMGKIYAKKNMTDDAIEALNKAIEIDQENAEYILFRADILLKNKDYDAAIFDYTRLQRMRPSDASIRRSLQKAQDLKKKENTVDYYAILNVSKTCSQYEIKDAFRKLVRKWHPDRYPGKEEKKHAEMMMKQINTAYDILNNPGKRKYYDNGGDMEQYTPGAENMMQAGAQINMGNLDQILRTMFSQAGGQAGAGGQQFIIFQQ
jgi:tetratricopeptide (TPR) repeat protein